MMAIAASMCLYVARSLLLSALLAGPPAPAEAYPSPEMAQRDKPPFRADHVGSLLRPDQLLQAREDHKAGRIEDSELRGIEDEAIRGVVRMQRDAGLQTATDGEFRRASWHMDFIYSLGGISHAADNITVKFHNPDGDIEFTPAALHVDEKIRLEHTIFGDDFEFLRDTVSDGQTPKLTIPSPSMVHYRGGAAAIDPAVYPDRDEFWSDLTSAYADQVKAIAGLGCTYLQFDDTSLAYLNDPQQRAMIAERGEDADHLHEQYIRHINEALAGRPEGMAITTHMCRGNFRSSWVAEGGYDFVAEALFNELGVDGFFLEYDDARSGGFEPLRFVPKGKQVVLGLVTTKRGELEQKDELKRRIEEASQYVPLDQLCLSPQCGFSSTVEGNALSYDQEVAKLRLIVETAEEVWS
jgi:5-methyltetrahydropteroyltriglutamate--homocysteine methyltransferase